MNKNMQIPFHRPYITEDEINGAVESIRSGWITMGNKTIEFENEFSRYVGSKNTLAVNSCTAALHLALKAIGLGPGDEVIIPAITFAATAEVVVYFGARPVVVDVDRDSHLLDVAEIEKNITEKTKAIIPVHFSGQACDMDEILSIARRYRLHIIEDAAHSFPASYKGRLIGAIGDITAFSFYATKTITTGEGGMITTENDEWANRMKILRLHGIDRDAWKRYTKEGSWEYDVVDAGYKYNTTDINSAIGLAQLSKAEWMRDERRKIADKYNKEFSENDCLIPYYEKQDRVSAWHLYPLKLNLESLSISRNDFIIKLKEMNIGTSVHFIPLYRFTYYRDLCAPAESYRSSEWIYERQVSLPVYPGLSSDEIDYIVESVSGITKKYRR